MMVDFLSPTFTWAKHERSCVPDKDGALSSTMCFGISVISLVEIVVHQLPQVEKAEVRPTSIGAMGTGITIRHRRLVVGVRIIGITGGEGGAWGASRCTGKNTVDGRKRKQQ